MSIKPDDTPNIQLAGKENFSEAMQRIYAWFECEVIDRPPVKFATHNSQYNPAGAGVQYTHKQWKARYFDTETVVEDFIKSIEGRKFPAENFPVYWPNLGPDIYAAFYGSELIYDEVTSWAQPLVIDESDVDKLVFNPANEYYTKIQELTAYALERCEGKFLVGYTDLHPGLDCALSWRGPGQLCLDTIENRGLIKRMIDIASKGFAPLFKEYHRILKQAAQPSVNWLEIPSFQEMHIPSCDFATLISPADFEEFGLPLIVEEVKHATHNIFHLDGKGVAKNIDAILEIPEIQCIQWAQGVADNQPIMQWVDLIKRIQNAGKGVIVDLQKHELEEFIDQVNPEGIFLWIPEHDETEQEKILQRLKKWS
ncbi:MAG: hypothetical protein HN350_07885 [Phycisphaerales bacterium]|jgi:hypothetical protein|nr:hypothetical protein [Phycisphaerales bacterium]